MVYNKIVVVGAGIVGINTALELQRVYPNIKITIIADKFNSETLSDGAAGIFRPGTYCFGPSFEISQLVDTNWIGISWKIFKCCGFPLPSALGTCFFCHHKSSRNVTYPFTYSSRYSLTLVLSTTSVTIAQHNTPYLVGVK
ncbi:uncharacterized protein LOC126909725 [Daktulosphaira vitifoliae]|uniref:uncharacterized protein LOC126909725 n=1 Tax=Daktulosphaira vitifoliae TaxID=58002 RepID=UPI0021AAA158|nr:uncharacterized protein LOC126909725 [Daktulosphaira vitifoliae]XP_050548110.1 uncharacterized protein LOC126909725 [Daktulosphaira vitifoliae]